MKKAIFEMMLRCRLNVIRPAMHPGGYEFVTRPEWDGKNLTVAGGS